MLNLMRNEVNSKWHFLKSRRRSDILILKKEEKRSYRFLICNDWDQGVLQNEPHNVTQYESDDQMTVDNVPQAS